MKILAIETSCDETAIAVVEASGGFKKPKFKILSNIVSSQVKIHAKWGGVVPNLAKREHQRNLPFVLKKTLKESKLLKISKSKFLISKQFPKSQIPDIDLIAVTIGPGLEPALWTGINFARDLNKVWGKPIIGINHLEGHIFSVFLNQNKKKSFEFPVIALLVSGGHTELVLIKNWLKYKIIGQTRDDAAGEAFDKVAKMLGLPYPGGPAVARQATEISKSKFLISKQMPNSKIQIKLPRPMINSKDYDFSFSGLKTAVLYKIKELGIMNQELKSAICHEFQQAVIDVLISKTLRAAKEYGVKTIILGGGVAANEELRKQLSRQLSADSRKLNFFLPEKNFTTDNAAMIAAAAYFHALKTARWRIADIKKLKANGNLKLS